MKIVHPVIHRSHYRRWMTYAGVILPWFDGVCCFLIPAWATAEMVDGKCLAFIWPTPAMYSAYTLIMFVCHYVVPPAFFFIAYYSIIGVIRRQNLVVPANVDTIPSTSARCSTRQASRVGHGKKKHQSQMNAVRTMITIVVCFCICCLPFNIKVYYNSPFLHRPRFSSYLPQCLRHFTFFQSYCHFESLHLSSYLLATRYQTCDSI